MLSMTLVREQGCPTSQRRQRVGEGCTNLPLPFPRTNPLLTTLTASLPQGAWQTVEGR